MCGRDEVGGKGDAGERPMHERRQRKTWNRARTRKIMVKTDGQTKNKNKKQEKWKNTNLGSLKGAYERTLF